VIKEHIKNGNQRGINILINMGYFTPTFKVNRSYIITCHTNIKDWIINNKIKVYNHCNNHCHSSFKDHKNETMYLFNLYKVQPCCIEYIILNKLNEYYEYIISIHIDYYVYLYLVDDIKYTFEKIDIILNIYMD